MKRHNIMNSVSKSRLSIFAMACVSLVMVSATHAERDFSDLVDQFEAIDTIQFNATVDARLTAPDPEIEACGLVVSDQVIEGKFDYVASGDQYRVDSFMDTSLYPQMDTTIAYDGDYFQMLMAQGTLTLKPVDTDAVTLSLPNPILELAQFLDPLDDDNADRRKQLKVVRTLAANASLDDVQWETVNLNGTQRERTILPGGTYNGVEYEHHVYVQPGDRDRPVRIDRVTVDDGTVHTSARFSHYVKHLTGQAEFHWPTNVELVKLNTQGEPQASFSYVIHNLKVNEPVDESEFTIDWSLADRVWDDAAEAFIAQ